MKERILKKLKEMLEAHEGKKSHAYQDVGGKWHIGIGRNIDPSGLGLADDEIEYLLDNDIVRAMRELAHAFPWYSELDEVRADALIMIAFNLGLTRLRKFEKALAAMEEGNYVLARIEFMDSLWSKQVGHRAEVLSTMIETGQYPDE